MANKVKFGLKNVVVFPITEDTAERLTYGSAIKISGAVSLSIKASGDSNEFSIGDAHRRDTTHTGGDQPHNNMPPYHVVQFIEYVGFQVAP